MLPILQIGPLSIQTPGLVLLAGLWIGLEAAERSAKRYNLHPALVYNLVILSIVAGIAGGRLLYALQYPQAFASNPASLVSLNPGLFDRFGALLTGVLAGGVYAKRKNVPALNLLDALTPLLGILSVAAALANLASGSGFGLPTQVPWAIELWGERRHPSQVYEMGAALVILGLILTWQRKRKFICPGQIFLAFVALSAAARLFFEGFRGDGHLLAGSIRSAQLGAWILLALTLWGLGKLRNSGHVTSLEDTSHEPIR